MKRRSFFGTLAACAATLTGQRKSASSSDDSDKFIKVYVGESRRGENSKLCKMCGQPATTYVRDMLETSTLQDEWATFRELPVQEYCNKHDRMSISYRRGVTHRNGKFAFLDGYEVELTDVSSPQA